MAALEEGADPLRRESWRGLFEGLAASVPLRGVLHLGGLEAPGEDAGTGELAAGVSDLTGSALALLQGLSDAGAHPALGVSFVTRGGQVVGEETGCGIAGSVLWGLGRSAARELGEVRVRLFDVDAGDEGWSGRLAGELLYPDREGEVAFRGGERRVRRLTRLASGAGEAGDRIRGDRSYLVTGGLGGLGLRVAGWLGERGAGAIVLSGRRGAEGASAEAVAALRGRGFEVRVEIADVTDEAAVRGLVTGLAERGLPPLGGVIHAAGVLSDRALVNQDGESFARVLGPKVLGAWNLHRATLGMELELFVLFSSLAGLIGNAGQSNYAAANAYLDQLASWRRGRGLSGQAIAWGAWSGSGLAEEARERVAGRLAALGGGWLTPEQGLAALDRIVRDDVAESAAALVDWGALGDAAPPLFEDFVSAGDAEARGMSPGDLLDRLRRVDEGEREEVLVSFLREQVQSILRLPAPPPVESGFFELGMDSLMAVELRNRVSRAFGGEISVPNTVVFDHPDIGRLGRYLAGQLGDLAVPVPAPQPRPRLPIREREDRVAIVGMGGRFPGGLNLGSFWERLAAGADLVTKGRPDGLMVDTEGERVALWGAYVPNLDRFDAEFFRIAPAEAELMDPQQRLLLESTWDAIEDAGIDPEALRGSRTGVYAGIMNRDYEHLLGALDTDQGQDLYLASCALTGNGFAAALGRVSFVLGLQGPAIAVDTACSSSLVVIHQAVSALLRDEVNLAFAGGVNAMLIAGMTEAEMAAGMLSPRGRCKTFDAAADGYVRGEGCGILVLKRLSDAERDGDRILGVVLGSAVNQDGASAGFTVPNGPAQEAVIREALERAGVAGSSVDYLEAHGTGTELGDPIEVRAAAAVYGEGRDPERPLLMGSVKTNIGHLESAAGVAGVIKALLAMRAGVIPKHLHFERPNPRIPWEELPVRVTSEATPWPAAPDRPLRAGVSSFGYSGTNAHVILEGYGSSGEACGAPFAVTAGSVVVEPAVGDSVVAEVGAEGARRVRVLPLSGRSVRALSELAGRYLSWLGEGTAERSWEWLSDAAWTAGIGRRHFGERSGVRFRDGAELREQLAGLASSNGGPAGGGVAVRSPGKVGFLFTGQGSQWVGMGKELYEREPVFRGVLDRCEEVLREERGASLLGVMFGGEGGELDATEWTQPALYALQAALVALWASVGVEAEAVLGHSVGELSAAQAAGVFGLEEGLRFASRRGALMGSLPREGAGAGGMLAVFAGQAAVSAAVSAGNAGVSGVGLALAAANGSHQVVSGPLGLVGALEERLAGSGIRVARLRTSHAFHSGLMDPVLEGVESAAGELGFDRPSVPLVSDVSGRVAALGEVEDAGYWRRQARSPVLFASGLRALSELGVGVLVEVGPRAVLGPLALLGWPGDGEVDPASVSSQVGEVGSGDVEFAGAVSAAYEAGVRVRFEGLYAGERRRRVSVPSYPFQRERHWVKIRPGRATGGGRPLLGVRHDLASGELMFEIGLSADAPNWISEHRVFGRVVAPGALYGAQALAAVWAAGARSGAGFVEDFQIERPMLFPDEGSPDAVGSARRTVQVMLRRTNGAAPREFAVYSRGEDEEEWVRHAAGRVGWGSAPETSDLSAEARERLRSELVPVDVAALYARLEAAGLRYGPSFRGLVGLWAGDREAIGEVWLPAGVEQKDGVIHPVLLDACFQVLGSIGSARNAEADALWLPVGWDRLWIGDELPERVWCRAALREGASGEREIGEWTAELSFYGEDGSSVGGVSGFRLRRASRSALLSAAAGVEELLYGVEWRESTGEAGLLRSADFLLGPKAVKRRLGERSEPSSSGIEGEALAGLAAGLEELSRSYVLQALAALGFESRAGTSFAAEELRRELRVVEQHRRLFGRLLSMLEEAGVVASGEEDGEWAVLAGASGPGLPDPEEQGAELARRYPGGSVELGLLRRCGAALPEVLRGRAEGTELLFSGEPDAGALYRESPGYRALNRVFAESVGLVVSRLPAGERLRVLEVGAGTGGSTGPVLGALPESRTNYAFTDVSAAFLREAEKRFGGSAATLEYRVLDIERDPGEQGYGLHRYDVVLAAHALYATRDLGESLGHCRQLLAPSGVLVLLEGVERQGWLDLTFGLLPGWWRFEDGHREDYPLVSGSVWRRALVEAGYEKVGVVGVSGSAGGEGAAVVLARAPAEVRAEAGVWVVCPGGAAAAEVGVVVGELEARGQEVAALEEGADPLRRESWRGLFEGLAASVPLRGVLHLGGLEAPGEDAGTGELAAGVADLTGSALALLQGMYDAGAHPALGVSFVTRGGQVVGEETGCGIAGSVLWGLGRSAARELGEVRVRLFDVDAGDEGWSGRLAGELLYPDGEEEVAFRGGERRVRRLTRLASGAGEAGDRIRGDRSYLVTGGLGGLGLRVAGWLGERGAGAIVLSGRRGAEGASAEAVAALRGRGFAVRVEIADVTDEAAVRGLVTGLAERGLPPLGGVIHAAGVVSDRALVNQDGESLARVLGPKVLGAWNLHRATLGMELELFVLFSSLAGLIGNAGQSNYAAANAYLDQLASWRRGRGLSGQAIAWGAWSGSGLAEEARERVAGRLAALGGGWLTPEQGIRSLDRLVRDDVLQSAVALLDWDALGDEAPPLFEDFASERDGGERGVQPGDLLERLRRVDAAEREVVLVSFLREQVRSVLHLQAPPAAESGFFELGMDSLMAVELRNRVGRALVGAYAVPNTVVFDHPTIARLGSHLLAQLELGPARRTGRGGPKSADSIRTEYERVRRLDDDEFFAEADALLRSD